MAVGQVRDRGKRSVAVAERYLQVVAPTGAPGLDVERIAADPPAHGVDEVATLTDEARPFDLLDKYANEGVDDIEDIHMLKVRPLTGFGTPTEIIERFGGKDAYVKAVRELEDALYANGS